MINLWGIIERSKNKWLRYYRSKVFKWYTHSKPEHLTILGNITLINPNIKVGKNVTIYPNCMFFGDGDIVIGDNVYIGSNTIIYAKRPLGGVFIGDNTNIAANNYIIDSNHGTKCGTLISDQPVETNSIYIGNDVWIATGCQIIKGARIGDGAVIGAGSLVNKEIPDGWIAFGSPAKPYRERR